MTDEQLRDPLTGLLRGWWSDATGELDASVRWLSAMSPETWIFGIRIADFGLLLREHGVENGDPIVTETAHRLVEVVDPWPVFRGDGAQFLVVVRLADEWTINRLAMRIRLSLERRIYDNIAPRIRIIAVQASEAQDPRHLALLTLGALAGPVGLKSDLVSLGSFPPPAADLVRSGTPARDQLTGLRRGFGFPDGRPGPETEEPWLASLPGDAVFLGFGVRGFKQVNNRRGHSFGDRLLAEFARRLQAAAWPWRAYRDGPDEFLVAAVLAGEPEIRACAAVIRAAIERPYQGVAVENWAIAAMASLGQSGATLAVVASMALQTVKRQQSSDLLIVPPDSDGRPPASALVPR